MATKMIISKTPLRMSFVGGGSDIPCFYRDFGGAVLSASINKYIYVNVNKKFDSGIRVGYSENEEVSSVNKIKHSIVREALIFLKIDGGVEITTIADIPSRGTGLGSSSTFTVGLLNALYAYKGISISQERLASDSCDVEIKFCGAPIGKQDQYAAAFGGFNLIEFKKDDSVLISPVVCSHDTTQHIQENILLFFTGVTRNASMLLRQQAVEFNDFKVASIKQMVDLTYMLAHEIRNNNIGVVGEILDQGWAIKKTLSENISNSDIDYWYQLAKNAGASGGKILGAGAGGFLMVYADPRYHTNIKNSLNMLRKMSVKFDPLGSQIIFGCPKS